MTLPSTAVKYSESPIFTQHTIPEALRKDHSTKQSVWGLIVVSKGALLYVRDQRPAQRVIEGECATIFPTEPHFVQPDGDVEFKVEFYKTTQ